MEKGKRRKEKKKRNAYLSRKPDRIQQPNMQLQPLLRQEDFSEEHSVHSWHGYYQLPVDQNQPV
jgi:hypothetical protein